MIQALTGFNQKSIKTILFTIILALVLLHIYAAFFNLLITDEYETYATARFIHQGKIIFKDFFQHHGTLPYFFYSTVFYFTNNLYAAVFLMKVLALVILLSILALLYLFTRTIAGEQYSPVIGWLPLYVILNDIIWWRYGLQIRTDNLMIVFFMASLYFLLIEPESRTPWRLGMSGFCASLAFFSKQTSFLLFFIFLVFYFQNNFKKYFIFLLGALPIILAHLIYFLKNRALAEFINYFILFNFRPSKYGSFSLAERAWFLLSPRTPAYVKIIYVVSFFAFVALSFYLYKKTTTRNQRFFRALFYTAFLGLALTFSWKTPYPQYYMPLEILFYWLGTYYFIYLQRFKKFFVFMVTAILLGLPAVTGHYFLSTLKPQVSVGCQLRTIEEIRQKVPSGIKTIGPLPLMTVLEPVGFHWFYPPIFVDLNTDFLNDDLGRADLVIYDFNLYFLAPRQFKKILFNHWHLADRFYCPFYFTEKNIYEVPTIFARSEKTVREINKNFQSSRLGRVAPELSLLAQPIYIPLYFKMALQTAAEAIPVNGLSFIYRGQKRRKVVLRILLSGQQRFFDYTLNTIFPERPKIHGFESFKNKIIIRIPYQETQQTAEVIGWNRKNFIYRPLYSGIIELEFNEPPRKITSLKSGSELILEAEFYLQNLSISVRSYEKEEK